MIDDFRHDTVFTPTNDDINVLFWKLNLSVVAVKRLLAVTDFIASGNSSVAVQFLAIFSTVKLKLQYDSKQGSTASN